MEYHPRISNRNYKPNSSWLFQLRAAGRPAGCIDIIQLIPTSVEYMHQWISIGSDNGLSPVSRQAIIWTNAGLVSIGPLATIFSEIRIKIDKNFHSQKCIWKKNRLRNGGHFVQGGGGGGGRVKDRTPYIVTTSLIGWAHT